MDIKTNIKNNSILTSKEYKRDSQGMRDPVGWDEDIGHRESFYGRNTTKTVFI